MAHKLLLADDSHTIQRVVELTLANEDIDVVTVGDGAQAIEAIKRDDPDIVLADVSMPGRNGYDVASFVRSDSARAAIPIVLLTGAFEPLDQARCDAIGRHEVLVKPFEPREVVGKVRELLELPAAGAADVPTGAALAAEPATATTGADASDEAGAVEAAAPKASLKPESESQAAPAEEAAVSPSEHVAPSSEAADADSVAPAASPPDQAVEAEAAAPPAGEATPEGAGRTPRAGAGGSVLAESFVTFLAVEQGAAPPELPAAGAAAESAAARPLLPEAVMDKLVDRVVERLTDTVLRDTVAEVVSRIAERLAREEITRVPPGE